jgi:organic radical activating enzyme
MEGKLAARDPPFLRNVGLLLTYHCQASCAHCILRAGPQRRERVALEDARRWISEIAAYRDGYVYVLSLTGGEPFSELDHLRSVMELAASAGLFVSVVTNGFWAVSRSRAREVLESLPKIAFLSISTDVYHQEFVPFERCENVFRACQDLGVPYYVSLVADSEDSAEFQRIRAAVLETTPADAIRTGVTFPVGRAEEIKDQLRYPLSDEPPREACQASSSPCIFPDGRVFGCIGPLLELRGAHPLLLGNVRERPVADVFEAAETNVVLHALRLWGPSRLIAMLRGTDLASRLPAKYVTGSICNACHELFSDEAIRRRLLELQDDAEFRRLVAYARLHYLDEARMLELGGFPDHALEPTTISG